MTSSSPVGADTPGTPSTPDAGEVLLRVAQRLEGLFTDLAGEHGLTAFQARTLRALHEISSQGALARRLGCTASRVSIVTRELEGRGLVSKVASVGDRRMRVARPTTEGTRIVDAIGAGLAARSPLVSGLTDDQVADLFRLLSLVEATP
ncbi:MarR family winged helix-turn-helix transcriptional regulator [Nocardiopsis sp. N85]|uniref:MarR family winged helix-turn-helix transcriptional regulator n=1 Tax=Nocardiopsis sp. N85 TaxID=3029400 RepID=UPI00237F90E7|nr:MarR family winged helix-turn-helix transcriptional regulator [Nocardiopsis sp. N85]MDE3720817.1 MarR family winged helix-turn-helix transcriptional regulator [Nocardiopsis sp. N85]